MPASGAVLAGRYRIIAPLGAGGMATVHRARDERLEREVAVKILLPNHAGDPVLAARFEREARSLAAAAHPGVVAVFDVEPGDPAAGVEPFFVMELCPGGSLADRLTDGRRLGPDELVPILISVADGLAGLHARGVVHRDVKPSNILLAPARAKLADFGLARSDEAPDASDLTAPGTTVGTMGYLAPDVLAGGAAGPPGDVYALGVAAFAGLTGTMPHRAGSIAELVSSAAQPAPLVSSVAGDLGTAFDEPIAAALDPDPAKRPDAVTLAGFLTTALGHWSRALPGTAAAGQMADLDATTVVVPTATPVVRPTSSSEPGPSPAVPVSRGTRGNLIAAAVIGGLIVGALALAFAPRPESGRPSSSVAALGASLSPPASIAPSPSASVPTAAPTPAETASLADRALEAVGEVDAAIAAIRASNELKKKDIDELERRARDIRSALEASNLKKASDAANGLSNSISKLGDQIDEDRARRLEDAVTAVVGILQDQ